jgi:hypothetical protein
MMQLLGAIATEALNMYQICLTYNINNIISSYVQFGIISEIDNLYAQSLKNNFFMTVLRESEIEIHSTEEEKKRSVECNICCLHSIFHWAGKLFYRAVKILYSTFYFYFAPYAVIVLSLYKLHYSPTVNYS